MAIELKVMPISTERYRSTDISGDYAMMARAFGGYGERITELSDIVPAIRRGIEQTRKGVPALLEFITCKERRLALPARIGPQLVCRSCGVGFRHGVHLRAAHSPASQQPPAIGITEGR
jgi:hypothetical protein